jgi:L-aspartate oxidase
MAGRAEWPRAELEPRDIVSRAVWAQMQDGHRVFLDARGALGARFAVRFPGITASCLAAGIDPAMTPIPIRPAAHYHMGGIAVDAACRSTVPGLWACGEAARTGLHGANRLASNSLLEAAVTGQIAARSVAGTMPRRAAPVAAVSSSSVQDPAPVRAILSRHAGVLRNAEGLSAAAAMLAPMAAASNAAALGLMMVVAMQRREESRGGHARTDFPSRDPALAHSMTLTLDQARRLARQSSHQEQARHAP